MVSPLQARDAFRVPDCASASEECDTCVGSCKRFVYRLWRSVRVHSLRESRESGCPLKRMSEWESDLVLAERVAAGDRAAVEEFARRMQCVPLIVASLNARRGRPLPPGDVNDLAQDVFVLLWKKLPAFQGLSTLESWVFRFCHYEFLNALRRRRRGTDHIDVADQELLPAPPSQPNGRLEYGALHQTLERLAPREAAVIRAKHFDGLTFEEIGARLSMPPNTAKTHYYRGLERLRILLRSANDEESK